MRGLKLLSVSGKEKEIREFWKTLQKMREIFRTKTKKQSSFECLKLLKLLQIFPVNEPLPNHPYL